MKATDLINLMTGDWVLHFGEKARIVGIRIDNYNNSPYFKTNLHDTWYESGVDGIEPIPLTSEILEKNGFERKDTDYLIQGYLYWSAFARRLFIKGFPYQYGNIIDICECTYVHELQHAFKLCKIDREIVL